MKIFLYLLILGLTFSNADDFSRGKKVFETLCQKDKLSSLLKLENKALQNKIEEENICQKMNPKNLKALLFYLRQQNQKTVHQLTPPKDAKCQICGMFVTKYPKWISSIEQKDGKQLYFDGVKDMMKFYFKHKEDIKTLFVQDYYTLKPLDAQKAYFVVGSNIYGPMGEELIPFLKLESAKEFKTDHDGKKILTFSQIQEKNLY